MINSFWPLAALMTVGACGILLLLPRFWRRAIDGESTADWVRLRREELAGSEGQLLDEVELRALEDLSPGVTTAAANISARSWPIWWTLPVLVLIAVLLYRLLGSYPDLLITQDLAELDPSVEAEVVQLIERIEARTEARPSNLDYLSLLGQYHSASGEHGEALRVYEQMLELLPDNPEALGRAAQAQFLAGGGSLDPVAKARAEAALAIDPNQRAALATLGMGLFEAGEYAAAIGYWQRMLALESPGSPGHQMLQQVIAEAAQRTGTDTVLAAATVGIEVVITAPDSAAIEDGTTIFVLARPTASQSRMPTAVVRERAGTWPLRVRLSDDNSMAGQQLSALDSVQIEVQVSPAGQPGVDNASWLATADNVVPSTSTTVELKLEPASR